MMIDLQRLVRPHLKELIPYASARDDYKGSDGVFLDANENPMGSITAQQFNRYPDPYQVALKKRISEVKTIGPDRIFLGNGSDEPIDLLFRAFCEPGKDQVVLLPPTYGMYQVSAAINNVHVKAVNLTPSYDLDVAGVLAAVDIDTKLIFVCSPNNPTGNDLSTDRILEVVKEFKGIVIVDEAYIDFASRQSFIKHLDEYPNLVVLQTFSKAWGLAALRLGVLFASEEIVTLLNKIKAPYNISGLTQQVVLDALEKVDEKERMVSEILANREVLKAALEELPLIEKVYPSDANFLLVKMGNAREIYERLIREKVIVRDRSKVTLCEGCLRITVGTKTENQKLVEVLRTMSSNLIDK